VIFLPDGKAKGIFHIVHGMTEHIARYEWIMTALAENGYIACGYDNLGHGNTANEGEHGFIASENGYELLAKDVKEFSDAVKKEYGKDLPYILMGHSMGSFIVRYAALKYVKPNKLIIMGTGGKNPLAGMGLAVMGAIKVFKGERHVSALAYSLAFGAYNKRFPEESENDPSPWLTTDKAVREKYYADKYCTFKFTVSAMRDLIRLLKITNSGAWFKGIDKNMPILLVSGAEDPVGNYGKGVRQVENRLKKAGADVKTVIYGGARHEILNDFVKEDVKKDILEFIE
jgi:alpha-beta hydrolase superfamily lysophospholipase